MEISVNLEGLALPLGKTAQELAESLKADGEENITAEKATEFLSTLFADRLKGVLSTGREEGFGRGKKEVLSKAEREFSEQFGIESADFARMGEALVNKVKGSVKLDPNDVKNSDVYKAEVERFNLKIGEKDEALNNILMAHTRMETERKLEDYLNPLIEEYEISKPHLLTKCKEDVFSDTTQVRLNSDKSDVELFTKSGDVARNELGYEMKVPDLLRKHLDNYFDRKKKKPNTPGSNTQQPGQQQGDSFSFKMPESGQEMMTMIGKMKTLEEKKAFQLAVAEHEAQNGPLK